MLGKVCLGHLSPRDRPTSSFLDESGQDSGLSGQAIDSILGTWDKQGKIGRLLELRRNGR